MTEDERIEAIWLILGRGARRVLAKRRAAQQFATDQSELTAEENAIDDGSTGQST